MKYHILHGFYIALMTFSAMMLVVSVYILRVSIIWKPETIVTAILSMLVTIFSMIAINYYEYQIRRSNRIRRNHK